MAILVTGGARSGKSGFAESLVQVTSEVIQLLNCRMQDMM